MEPVYSNFDGLDISFQCALPEKILAELAMAKKQAQAARSDSVARIGKEGRVVLVGETGSRGGYTYRFDTGLDGETWLAVDSLKRDSWNIKVSVKSLALALYGYAGVKERVLNTLVNEFGARGVSPIPIKAECLQSSFSDNARDWPLERISRVDFCIDFSTNQFIPNPRAFVGKGRFKKRVLNCGETSKNLSEIVFTGQTARYLRIGSMPNRQVVLYDKISDITEKRKFYWWNLWGINKLEFSGQIWRVEARAGKKELNEWNLRRFTDFEKMAGNVISSILQDIKYTIPSDTDTNISRWPLTGFWQKSISIAQEQLQNYISPAQRKMILQGIKQDIIHQFEKMIYGQTVSYAALNGMDISEIPAVLDVLGDGLLEQIVKNQKKFIDKHQKSKDKYAHLED